MAPYIKTPVSGMSPAAADSRLTRDVRNYAGARLPAYLADLKTLVGMDSGSGNAAGIRRVADHLVPRLEAIGARVERVPVQHPDGRDLGDVLIARVRGDGGRRTILSGHLDTVYPEGEAEKRPMTVDDRGIARGPGVTDDKGGVLTGLYALEALHALDLRGYGEIILVLNPDEEIGSPGSRQLLAELSQGIDAALCLECARENGDIVSSRKGVADIVITVTGQAAHAGVEPERGASAAISASHLALALHRLNGRWADVTVNVGIIKSGSRPNVVAAEATLIADLRAESPESFRAAIGTIREAAADLPIHGTSARVQVKEPAVPWNERPADRQLADRAIAIAESLSLKIRAAATGGSADSNHFAELIPAVLDGLGPVGGDDHSTTEWLDTNSVPDRVALLATLLLEG